MHRLLAPLLAVALGITACTPASDTTTTTVEGTTSTSTPTTTTETVGPTVGQVRIGVDSPVLTINPLAEELFGAGRLVGQAVWATVFHIEPDSWERVPDIVTSLPSRTPGAIEVADDGSMTVRYEIVKGAMWSDGTPVSGEDIAFTAEAMAALSGGDPSAVMSTVTATDSVDRLAWITFSKATLGFEDALSVILPSHVLGDATDLRTDDAMDWPAGGPFMVAERPSGGVLELVANPHYWKTDEQGDRLPYLDSLMIVSPDEPGDEVDLFSEKLIEIVVPAPSDSTVERLAALAEEGAELHQVPTPIVEHLTFQFAGERDTLNPESSNDIPDFRKAVAHSIDRTAILDQTGVPWISETPGMLIPIGPSAWNTYSFDADESAALLQETREGTDQELPTVSVLSTTGNGDYRVRVGDALVDTFGDVGIDLDTSYLDSLIFFGETIATGEFDIGMWAWVSDGGFASQLTLMDLLDPASEATDANFGNWGFGESAGSGPETFSELAAEARTTTDFARFAEIVAAADETLAEHLPMIPLFQRSSIAAVWPDTVSGVVHNGSVSEITWNAEVWRVP